MTAASLIAYPSGNSNVQVEVQVRVKFLRVPREAVGDATDEISPLLSENRKKVVMSIPLVKKDRKLSGGGDL